MILRCGGSRKIEVKVNRFSPDLAYWSPPLLALTVPVDIDGVYREIFKARGLEADSAYDLALDLCHRFDPDLLCIVLPRSIKSNTLDKYIELCVSIMDKMDRSSIILGSDSIHDRSIMESIIERIGEYEVVIGPADMNNYRTYTALASIYKQNLLARSTTDINQAKQLIQLILDAGLPLERIALDIASTGLGLGLEDTYNLVEQAKLLYGKNDPLLSIPIVAFTWEAWDSPEIYTCSLPISRGMVWEVLSASTYILASADLIIILDPEAYVYARRLIAMLSGVV